MKKIFHIGSVAVKILAEGEDTNGRYALLEQEHPVGRGAPSHHHLKEDEGFYVLQGQYEFVLDGVWRTVSAGEFVAVPRGVVHGFRNSGFDVARMLIVLTPAGAERYFEAMGLLDRTAKDYPEKLTALDEQYGLRTVDNS